MTKIQYEDDLKQELLTAIGNHQDASVTRRTIAISGVCITILVAVLGFLVLPSDQRNGRSNSVPTSVSGPVAAESWITCPGVSSKAAKLRTLMAHGRFDIVLVGRVSGVGAQQPLSDTDQRAAVPIEIDVTQVLRGPIPDGLLVMAPTHMRPSFESGQSHLIGIRKLTDGTSLATGCPLTSKGESK